MKLEANGITKRIRKKIILDNISISMNSGNIYGIVGRNGSGKTMLFRALSGLMKIDSGSIVYDNKELHKDINILPNLGIVIENAGLYPELTGLDNLKMLAKLKNKVSEDDIISTIERVGLNPKDKRPYRKYSLGMKQRIIIAQAIMEKPDIIMFDEPTNALDEEGVDEVRKIILEEKERGALILLASHNKEDIKLLADKVFYIQNGKISNDID